MNKSLSFNISSIPAVSRIDYFSSMMFAKAGKWKHAARSIKKYADNIGLSSAAHYYRAGYYHQMAKQFDVAEQFYEKSYGLSPGDEKCALRYVDALVANKKLDMAADVCRDYWGINPQSHKVIYKLSTILRKQKKWWQEIEALQAGLELQPDRPHRFFQLGEALEIMNRYDQAAEAFAESAKRRPTVAAFYRQGFNLEKAGRRDEAHALYEKAIELDDNPDSTTFGVGVYHQKRGLWVEAKQAYERQLAVEPDCAPLLYRLGMAHDRCYEWKEAADYYTRALELDETQEQWQYRLGFVFERMGKGWEQRAADAYRRATEISEKHHPYWFYRLGYVLEQAGECQQACEAFLEMYEQAGLESKPAEPEAQISSLEAQVEQDCTSPKLWWSLGHAYEQQGDWERAVHAYRHALDRANNHTPEWYYRLGYALMQLGDFSQACHAFRSVRVLQKPYGVSDSSFRNDAGFREAATYLEYHEALEVQDDVVLYESFHGARLDCNPYAIFLFLYKEPKYKDWKHVWVVNNLTAVPSNLRSLKNVVFVARNSDAYLRYLSCAAVLINNSTFPPYFIRKPSQKYLNTWHGTPWKFMGKDITNNFMEHKNTQRNFLHATHLLSPNEHSTNVFLDRYDIKDMFQGDIAELGYPRIDLTLNASETEKINLYSRLGLDGRRKVVLYAPTWRGTLGNAESDMQALLQEIRLLNSVDCDLLFRGHYFSSDSDDLEEINALSVPSDITTNELLSIVDVLVTDYSSIAFDFMATGRPIIYYLHDYAEYSEDRGLYFHHTELPGSVCFKSIDLVAALSHEIDSHERHGNYKAAKDKFCPHEDGMATQKVANWLMDDKPCDRKKRTSKRKSLLFASGEFMPNGITTSFNNLVSHIDCEKYSLHLLIDPNTVSKEDERLEQFGKLPSEIKVIPRVGGMNRSIEEKWVNDKFNQYHGFLSKPMRDVYEKAFSREFIRIFGQSYFDAVIEFSGYSRFWSSILGCASEQNAGKKLIYQYNDKLSEWLNRFPNLQSIFNLYSFFDNLVSVSEKTRNLNKQSLISKFSLPAEKFIYCDNLQNPDKTLFQAEEPIDVPDDCIFQCSGKIFITMGRLSPEKAHDKLIRAFAELRNYHPESKLLILGDGPLKSQLQLLVQQLDQVGSVHILGRRANPFPLLKRADCFVLSSDHEGQPMVLFEAMILNKPIISTDIVGSRSALEGRSGVLVDNSQTGLFHGMKQFIEGEIRFEQFDISDYQSAAINMFYKAVSW